MTAYTRRQIPRAFEQVEGHVLELHARWRMFRKLYRGNADSVPILTSVGSEMFWILGRLLHRGSLLLFRRLTDGPESMGHRNASFEGLLKVLGGENYRKDHADLMGHVAALRAKTTIRDHVNKYIANLDLDLLAGAVSSPDGVDIIDFEDALRVMRELTMDIGERFVPDAVILEFESGAT